MYLHLNLVSSSPNAPSNGKDDAGVDKQNNARTAKTKRQVRKIVLLDPFSLKI